MDTKKEAVWKYALNPPKNPGDGIELFVQRGARLLHAAEQTVGAGGLARSTVCLWMQVVPEAPVEKRTFFTFPTGYEFDPMGKYYMGTVTGVDKYLVFHVYEAIPLEEDLSGHDMDRCSKHGAYGCPDCNPLPEDAEER